MLGLVAALAVDSSAAICLEKTERLPAGWKKLEEGPEAGQAMEFSIALRQPQADRLRPLVSSGARLSAEQVSSLREPDRAEVAAVLGWLADAGIREAEQDKDWIRVRTTVDKAESLLSTRLHHYSFEGRPPVLRTAQYSVPEALAEAVSFIHPLANFMTPTHDVAAVREAPGLDGARSGAALQQRRAAGAGPVDDEDYDDECRGPTTPKCIRQIYNITYKPIPSRSPARFAVAGFLEQYANYADMREFMLDLAPNISANSYNFTVELVNGGQNDQEPSKAGVEASLDIQYAMAIGYPTQINYLSTGGRGIKLDDNGKRLTGEAVDNEPYLELIEYLLNKTDDQLPHVLSISYADDELSVPRRYAERVCLMLGMLTGRGTSILVGSGDGGARGGRNSSCRTNSGPPEDITMATFPSTCPWVTAVGAVYKGTGEPVGANFSTGGFSRFFSREGWQDVAVKGYVKSLDGHLDGYYNAGMRAIPDISAIGTGFLTVIGGKATLLDGTSASTPVMAALISLVNDARLREGKAPLGWLNKRLYSGAVRKTLRDVKAGQSISCVFSGGRQPGGWPAKPGWDAITGLGVPGDLHALMRVLLDD